MKRYSVKYKNFILSTMKIKRKNLSHHQKFTPTPQICDNLTNGSFSKEQEAVQKVMMMLATKNEHNGVNKYTEKVDVKNIQNAKIK